MFVGLGQAEKGILFLLQERGVLCVADVAITPAQSQTASELRISGSVEKLDGNLVALSLSQGISIVVRLDAEPRVNSVAKGSGSDLKAGSQVSIQAKSGQSGDLIATQIVLFAPGSNRPDAEPGPDNAPMTAVKQEDGSLQVLRANFGPAGVGNPPL
jgi:hypothetical protein